MNVFETDKQYVANTYGRFNLEIVGGSGSVIYGGDGKEYIDMGTGIAVNTFGIADKEWQNAVCEQMSKFQHTSNLYYASPCAELAKLLCEKTGMKKVFFGNSGAEANECAIKVARKYGADTKGASCNKIITLKNSFHGRTVTTLAATGQDSFHTHFLPLTEGFASVEPDIESLEREIDENTCAIMFEIVRGEGGVLPLDKKFVDYTVKVAAEKDILLICDEVQCGNGRTGKLYSYMHYGFTPDIVTTAKGLGGGLPIGAAMLGKKVENTLTPGLHGSTFGGNPVCCAGALSILKRLDEKLLEEVDKKHRYIIKSLENSKGIEGVTGLGLMLGIKTVKPAKQVVSECMEKGVLVLTAKDKVRLLPALNIDDRLLEKAITIIKSVCGDI